MVKQVVLGWGARAQGEGPGSDGSLWLWLWLRLGFVLVCLRPLTLLLLPFLLQEHQHRPRHTTPWVTPATA